MASVAELTDITELALSAALPELPELPALTTRIKPIKPIKPIKRGRHKRLLVGGRVVEGELAVHDRSRFGSADGHCTPRRDGLRAVRRSVKKES